LTSYQYRTDEISRQQEGPTIEQAIHHCLRLRNTSSNAFPLHELLNEAKIRYELHDAKSYFVIAAQPKNKAESLSEQDAFKSLKGFQTGLEVFEYDFTLDAWPSGAVAALMAK
jgi:hypothetical protein